MEIKGTDFVRGEALLSFMTELSMTERERTLVGRYTAIRPVAVRGSPDAHTVWLVIDQQSFRLDSYQDTAEEAAWLCKQLATALVRMIDQQAAKAAGG